MYEVKVAEELRGADLASMGFAEGVRYLERYLDVAELKVSSLREELYQLSSEIEFKRRVVRDLRERLARLSVKVEEIEGAERRLEEITSKYGSLEDIRRRLEELEVKLASLRERQACEECVVRLRRSMVERGARECPVCLSDVDEGELRRLYEEGARRRTRTEGELRRLERERERLARVLEEARSCERVVTLGAEDRARYEEVKRRLEEEVEELRRLEESREEMELRIDALTSRLRELKTRLRELSALLKSIEAMERVDEYEERLRAIRRELRGLGFDEERYESLRARMEELRERLAELRGHREALRERVEATRGMIGEYENIRERVRALERRLGELRRLENNLARVKDLVRRVQGELRSEMVGRVRDSMKALFSRAYPYDDYRSIDLRVVQAGKRGEEGYVRTIYELVAQDREGRWVPVLSRMSDGQKTIVAVMLIVTLFKMIPHNLGFLILDEPAPNVDELARRRLVESLLGMGIDQVVVATQSETLARELARVGNCKIYELTHDLENPIREHPTSTSGT